MPESTTPQERLLLAAILISGRLPNLEPHIEDFTPAALRIWTAASELARQGQDINSVNVWRHRERQKAEMAGTPHEPGQPQDQFPVAHSGVTHEAPPEMLLVNKYHILWVLERMRTRRPVPHAAWWVGLATTCVALLIPLITKAQFGDALNLSANVWEAMVVLLAIGTGAGAIGVFAWWCWVRMKNPARTPEQILKDIIDEMAEDRKRLVGEQGQSG